MQIGRSLQALSPVFYGSFAADMPLADGTQTIVVALTGRQWQDLVVVTGRQRLVDAIAVELDADFTDDGTRFTHRELLAAVLRPWFAARTLPQVADALGATSVLWSPFRTLLEHAHELVAGAAAPVVTMREDEQIGRTLATAGPIRRPREQPPVAPAAPLLGQDTDRLSRDTDVS